MLTKLSLLLNIILIAALGLGAYKFVIQGSTTQTTDGRTAVLLSASERNFVLGEMRNFLETVQAITAAIGENDMATISDISRKIAVDDPAKMPAGLKGKLPLEFKTLGMDTHSLFISLAETAETAKSPQEVSTALSGLMLNCTTFHAGYRLDVEPSGS